MNAPYRVAIIQARASSRRFAGKVLEKIGGIPMVVFMAKRVLQAKIQRLIVATSSETSDDPLARVLIENGIECFRGSLSDVLDRFYRAACLAQAETVIRLTGDCPLIDADLIDAVAFKLESENLDYASNCNPPTYPDGLDVEAIRMEGLGRAWREARLASEREHVTPYFRRPEQGFRIGNVNSSVDLSHLRWTVDYPEDLEHVRQVLAAAGTPDPGSFDRFDLLRALGKMPVLHKSQFKRNEGYARSLENDSRVHLLVTSDEVSGETEASTRFDQASRFIGGEGDQWFFRNQENLSAESEIRERVADCVSAHLPAQFRADVLEVGCSNGANLRALSSRRKITAYGIDPSLAAVSEGAGKNPEFHLSVGTAHSLSFPDLSFDLVWFGFCLYLLDRELLMRASAEADRCLRNGGTLVILDFDSNLPSVRDYRHLKGIRSYKMDYSRLFLGNPAYVLVEKHSFSHSAWEWNTDPQERVGLWILKKTSDTAYTPG